MCVFCDIISGKLPSTKHYEDENFIIIDDISHKAKKHYLIIPKVHYERFEDQKPEDSANLGNILKKLPSLINELGFENGFRLIMNQGEAGGPIVKHLHAHILGGEKLPDAP